MSIMKKCCCCSLRGGVIAVGVIMLLVSLSGVASMAATVFAFKRNLDDVPSFLRDMGDTFNQAVREKMGKDFPGRDVDVEKVWNRMRQMWNGESYAKTTAIGIVTTELVMLILNAIFCILLFIPACNYDNQAKRFKNCLLPYLWWQPFMMIVNTCFMIWGAQYSKDYSYEMSNEIQQTNNFSKDDFSRVIVVLLIVHFLIMLFFVSLFWLVVMSCYQYLRDYTGMLDAPNLGQVQVNMDLHSPGDQEVENAYRPDNI